MGENNRVPQHVAIIMDGNGRWAKKRLLPRVAGHKKGVETIKEIAIKANEMGIKLLTVYAFSTENWGRPQDEVKFLMKLPESFFKAFVPELIANNVRVDLIGDFAGLPQDTQKVLQAAMDQTAHCTGMVLNFAMNYGGYAEIIQAVKSIGQDLLDGQLALEQIDANSFSQRLMTHKFGAYANPDLVIRTSGEQRLSNFLPWQSAYSEFYFTDVLWPDFSSQDFEQAIQAYGQRQRRFGRVNDETKSH